MKKDNYLERIELYTLGQMSASEQQAFEQELNSNPELWEAMERYKIARAGLDLLEEEALRKKFKIWRKKNTINESVLKISEGLSAGSKNTPQAQTSWFSSTKRIMAAASILLLIGLSGYFIFSNFFQESLFEASFYDPDHDGQKSGSNDPSLILAFEAYNNQDYDQAIELFKSVSPLNDLAVFYLAQAYFKLDNYPLAEKNFRDLLKMEDTSYKQEAEWNLLITLLSMDSKNQEALESLANISANEVHSFYEAANELSEQLGHKK